ncbi:MAG: CopG family ribbon-helix-helix protein [Actinomycetota bacterium]
MRVHIVLDDDVVREIDEIVGRRGRSRFIREAISSALAHRNQRDRIRAARGALQGAGHEWDADVAVWVREQRRSDGSIVG